MLLALSLFFSFVLLSLAGWPLPVSLACGGAAVSLADMFLLGGPRHSCPWDPLKLGAFLPLGCLWIVFSGVLVGPLPVRLSLLALGRLGFVLVEGLLVGAPACFFLGA